MSLDCSITKEDLTLFLQEGYDPEMAYNEGGMHTPDMLSLFLVLKRLQPQLVIESGVYNGFSTRLIRETVGPNAKIICLDPRDFDESVPFFKDTNPNTIYHMGSEFQDFESLDVSIYRGKQALAFFDDHQNQPKRVVECAQKGIQHIVFNDNYPVSGGSHFTLQHLFERDSRFPDELDTYDQLRSTIQQYHIFPNIFRSSISLHEGIFDCTYMLEPDEKENYKVFWNEASTYTWNTYVLI